MKTKYRTLMNRVLTGVISIIIISVYSPDITGRNYVGVTDVESLSKNEPATGQDQDRECFIWKVVMNDCLFYLTGSIHMGIRALYPLPQEYMDCYSASDMMIMELEEGFNEISDQILVYARKDRLPDDKFFRYHLDSLTVDKIAEILGKDEFLVFDQYEAWLLNMLIIGSRCKLTGYDPEYGIDKYFRELAEGDGKQVIGLDSLVDQLKLFEFEMTFESQVKHIENMVNNIDTGVRGEVPLLELYAAGDIIGFSDYFLGLYDFENPVMKDAYNTVFTQRNIKWVDKLEDISLTGRHTCMVLVGAGHFFGPGNLLELLRSKDYIVESVE